MSGRYDAVLANDLLQGASAWEGSCSATVQAEWNKAQSEVASAKKVVRIRKTQRR
jgi:hypothetical protein